MWRRGRVALVLAGALGGWLLAACGGDPPTPSASPEPGAQRIAVRLDGVDAASGMLHWHDGVILFGEEAADAARRAGDPMGAPNGVWIRELATTGSARLAEDARIVLLGHDADGDFEQKPAGVQAFLRVFTIGSLGTEWTDAPWLFLDVADGIVVGVEQPELP